MLCHPSVICLMAAKAYCPLWGFHPLHHVAGDVREPSVATLRYSSYDDPAPILDSAKLHYCYSNAIGAAFSAPVLLCHPGTPLLAIAWSGCPVVHLLGLLLPVCISGGPCCLPLLVYPPLFSLRKERMELRLSVRTSLTWLVLSVYFRY